MEIWLCSACARYSTGDSVNKLHVASYDAAEMKARREVKKQRPCPDVCQNPHCGTTMSTNGKWAFNVVYEIWT